MSFDRIYWEVSPIFLSKTAFWQPFGILLAYFIRPEAVLLQRILKHATMNIYGILTAAGLFLAYQKAKAKADEAYTAWLNYKSWLRSLNQKPVVEEFVDQNSELDGVEVSVVLRVGNVVGKFLSADGYVILTNTTEDRNFLITRVAASFTIDGLKVSSYIPIGVTQGTELRAGEQVQIPLSGNTDLIFFASGDDRDEFREKIIRAYNASGHNVHLVTSVPRNTDVDGICRSRVEFRYNNIENVGNPIRAIYTQIPTTVRYMGEAFSPNNRNDFEPTAGDFK